MKNRKAVTNSSCLLCVRTFWLFCGHTPMQGRHDKFMGGKTPTARWWPYHRCYNTWLFPFDPSLVCLFSIKRSPFLLSHSVISLPLQYEHFINTHLNKLYDKRTDSCRGNSFSFIICQGPSFLLIMSRSLVHVHYNPKMIDLAQNLTLLCLFCWRHVLFNKIQTRPRSWRSCLPCWPYNVIISDMCPIMLSFSFLSVSFSNKSSKTFSRPGIIFLSLLATY